MAHITIYRDSDGMPAWATVAGVSDEDEAHEALESVRNLIDGNARVLASTTSTFEVV